MTRRKRSSIASNLLAAALTRSMLKRRAWGRSFERGEAYFLDDRVENLFEEDGVIAARVQGTDEYHVELQADTGVFGYSCDCPVGDEGRFCKHCVAVGLKWMARHKDTRPVKKTDPGPIAEPTTRDIREYLEARDKNRLVELLMDQIQRDNDLHERFLMLAAKNRGGAPDVAYLRKAITRATRTHGYVHWRRTRDYVRRAGIVVDTIKDVLADGHAVAAVELAEHALRRIEKALGRVDDSDGEVGGIFAELHELHLDACRAARPEPKALARRLFKSALNSGSGLFENATTRYADTLGPQGIAEYQRLADKEWARLPGAEPDADDYEMKSRVSNITRIMETLAEQSGDIDKLVAVKARDLSAVHDYLEIARIYKEAGRDDDALKWAEEGAKKPSDYHSSELHEFLADEYLSRNRPNDAMNLVWAGFSDDSDLDTYQRLYKYADRIGQWPVWRKEALALLHERIENGQRRKKPKRQYWEPREDGSVLVEVLLWEGDPETAWREARTYGCSDTLLLQLAGRREKEHPEDAVVIYKQGVEELLGYANNARYEQAVNMLRRIGRVMKRIDKRDEFRTYLAEVREKNKRRPNLMKMMDQTRWP